MAAKRGPKKGTKQKAHTRTYKVNKAGRTGTRTGKAGGAKGRGRNN